MANETDQLKVLIAYGSMGVKMLAARLLSLGSLAGVVGLAFYVSWQQSWQGVACVVVVALCFARAVAAESGHRQPPAS